MKIIISIVLTATILLVLYLSINPNSLYQRISTRYDNENIVYISINSEDMLILNPTNILETRVIDNNQITQPISDTYTYHQNISTKLFTYTPVYTYKGITTGKESGLLIYNETKFDNDNNIKYIYELVNEIENRNNEFTYVVDIIEGNQVKKISEKEIEVESNVSKCKLNINSNIDMTLDKKYIKIPINTQKLELYFKPICND